MKKWLSVGIILLFVGTYFIPTIAQNSEKPLPISRGNTLYVGGNGLGNYTAIQDAINDANDGDTVFVFNGTYDENIELNKRLYLIGEDKKTTIIEGKQEGITINLSSENASIKNFTIIGGRFDIDDFTYFFRAGIRVTGSNNSICNNIFRENRLGISGVRVTNLTVKDNTFSRMGSDLHRMKMMDDPS